MGEAKPRYEGEPTGKLATRCRHLCCSSDAVAALDACRRSREGCAAVPPGRLAAVPLGGMRCPRAGNCTPPRPVLLFSARVRTAAAVPTGGGARSDAGASSVLPSPFPVPASTATTWGSASRGRCHEFSTHDHTLLHTHDRRTEASNHIHRASVGGGGTTCHPSHLTPRTLLHND